MTTNFNEVETSKAVKTTSRKANKNEVKNISIDLTQSTNKLADFIARIENSRNNIDTYPNATIEIKWSSFKGRYDERATIERYELRQGFNLYHLYNVDGRRSWNNHSFGDKMGYEGSKAENIINNAKDIVFTIMEHGAYISSHTMCTQLNCNYDANCGIEPEEYVNYIITMHPNWDLYDKYAIEHYDLKPRQIVIDGMVYAEGRTIEDIKALIEKQEAEEKAKAKEVEAMIEAEREARLNEEKRMVEELKAVAVVGYTNDIYTIVATNDRGFVVEDKDGFYYVYTYNVCGDVYEWYNRLIPKAEESSDVDAVVIEDEDVNFATDTPNEETAVVVEAPAEEKPKMSPNDYLRKVDLLEYKLVGEVDKGLTIPKIQEVIECVDNLTTEIEGLGFDMDSDEWVEVTLGLERLEEIKDRLEAVFDGLSELRGVLTNPTVDTDEI